MAWRRAVSSTWLAAILAVTASGTGAAGPGSANGTPDARLSTATVPANGRGEAILEVSRLGRYALAVSSAQGVALQLVDRMAGPSKWAGAAGLQDGRLDRFLEPGRYKLRTRGHPDAAGDARLSARRFRELNAPAPPRLVELKPVATSLGDVEQRSYWIPVRERRWVGVEAAGRHLRDLRLWRDGTWLMDAEPRCTVTEPRTGRPLTICRLTVHLDPGAYLLTAYGGPGQPWAEESPQRPLYLRWGIPTLGEAGRSWRRMSPFGIDRFLVPAAADLYRLELPEAGPAALAVGRHSPAAPFRTPRLKKELDTKHREPVVEISFPSSFGDLNLVEVRAPAGQPYVLQHFHRRRSFRLSGAPVWLAAIGAGDPRDTVEATGIVVCDRSAPGGRIEPNASFAIPIGRGHGWRRRCNLLDPLTVFLRVKDLAHYRVTLEGVAADYRFEPFALSRPARYHEPAPQPSGTTWELDPGFWVLTLIPRERGIVTVTVAADGEQPPGRESPRTLLRSPAFSLPDASCTLHLNTRPGVATGLVLRPLPVDLSEPLPLTVRPGEVVTVRVSVPERGTVRAITDDGRALQLERPGRGWGLRLEEPPGVYDLRLRLDPRAPAVTEATLLFEPKRLARATPLPPLPDAERPPLPHFPTVDPEHPLFLDLGLQATATLAVHVPESALYRLETTGLLATAGTLRNRTVVRLTRARSGGSGRNFLIQRYLRRGEYQLVVATRGSSRGHLGVRLTRSALAGGGILRPGVPARARAVTGGAILYRFTVERAGRYAITALRRGGVLSCRLEDGGGWPLLAPGVRADLTLDLDPGEYRLVVLPTPAGGRRVTTLRRLPAPVRYSGHSPHRLPLGHRVSNLWTEPADGHGPRSPDRWRFTLPAASPVQITLDAGMEGRLLSLDDGVERATVSARRSWRGTLEAGRYELLVRCRRRNNRVSYHLEVRPEALVAGTERAVTAPATLPVAVGGNRLVEIGSTGADDVSARLLDAAGRTVARSDDRPGDWSFLISGRFPRGRYTLEVSPVGAATARATVHMVERRERTGEPLRMGATRRLELGEAVEILPLGPVPPGTVLALSARASETLGLAVDAGDGAGGWRTLGADRARRPLVLIPGLPEGRLRVRVWSVDLRGGPIRLSLAAVRPTHVPEGRLADGVEIGTPEPGHPPAVVEVEVDGPGTFRVTSSPPGLLGAAAPGAALAPVAHGTLIARSRRLWLAAPSGGRLRAERIVLRVAPGDEAVVAVPVDPSGPVVLDVRGTGPMLAQADAPAGPVGVAWLPPGARRAELGWPVAAALAGRSAVALWPGRRPGRLILWSPGGRRSLVARVRLRALTAVRDAQKTPGIRTGEVAPGTMLRLRLPRSTAGVELGLGPRVVARTAPPSGPPRLLWGGRDGVQAAVGAGREVLLAVSGEGAGRYRVETLPAAPFRPEVAPGRPFEALPSRRGRLELPVAGDGAAPLHVAGAVTGWQVLLPTGRLLPGVDGMPAPRRGLVILQHGPGLVAVWTGVPWSRGEEPAIPLRLPASIPLAGARRCFSIHLDRPSLITVRHGGAAVVGVAPPGRPPAGWIDGGAATRHLLLPRGTTVVGLRGAAGAGLAGRLELTPVPAVPVREGLGDPVLLSPGSAAAFTFRIGRRRAIGLGARAGAEVVRCRLLTAGGRVEAAGTLIYRELEPGAYVLEVSCPAASRPVWIRPAVAGLEPPGEGPPGDVLRSYLASARGGAR